MNSQPMQRLGNSSWGRGKGTIFLVEWKSRNLLWSMNRQPKDSGTKETTAQARKIVEQLRKDLGIAPDSLEANKLSWFVLSRVSDYRLYEVYQDAGFSMDAAKAVVLSVLKDSSAYEVRK